MRSESLIILDRFSAPELALYIAKFGEGALPRLTRHTVRVQEAREWEALQIVRWAFQVRFDRAQVMNAIDITGKVRLARATMIKNKRRLLPIVQEDGRRRKRKAA